MINLRAKEAEKTAQMFKRQKAEIDQDPKFFETKEFSSSNK